MNQNDFHTDYADELACSTAQRDVLRYCGVCELAINLSHWQQCSRWTVCPRNWKLLEERGVLPVPPNGGAKASGMNEQLEMLAALVQRWEDKAREIDKGSCGVEELEQRDMLYWCAGELKQVMAMAFDSSEAAWRHNDQTKR